VILIPLVIASWVLLAVPLMVIVGRAARIADARESDPRTVEIPDAVLIAEPPPRAPSPRRPADEQVPRHNAV
jgi:hypothetical protein